MKTGKILVVMLIVGMSSLSYADFYNAIIYCNYRNSEVEGIKKHWKPNIPDVGVDEVIRDFVVLEKQGAKRVYHAMVDTSSGGDGQIDRIKSFIRGVNGCEAPTLQGPTCSTAVGSQILAWWDRDVTQMYTKMWQDRSTHAVFNTIAKRVLRYPVETICEGEPCTLRVSITVAEDTYGETIDNQKILIPHKFSGR